MKTQQDNETVPDRSDTGNPLDRSTPIDDVDQQLREAGLDPDAIGARGAALADALLRRRKTDVAAGVAAGVAGDQIERAETTDRLLVTAIACIEHVNR
jgi:hypothetical protein